LSHTFGYRYAGKPIKTSEIWDQSLVKRNFSQQIACLGWRPGLGNLSKKGVKHASIATSPTGNTTPKT